MGCIPAACVEGSGVFRLWLPILTVEPIKKTSESRTGPKTDAHFAAMIALDAFEFGSIAFARPPVKRESRLKNQSWRQSETVERPVRTSFTLSDRSGRPRGSFSAGRTDVS